MSKCSLLVLYVASIVSFSLLALQGHAEETASDQSFLETNVRGLSTRDGRSVSGYYSEYVSAQSPLVGFAISPLFVYEVPEYIREDWFVNYVREFVRGQLDPHSGFMGCLEKEESLGPFNPFYTTSAAAYFDESIDEVLVLDVAFCRMQYQIDSIAASTHYLFHEESRSHFPVSDMGHSAATYHVFHALVFEWIAERFLVSKHKEKYSWVAEMPDFAPFESAGDEFRSWDPVNRMLMVLYDQGVLSAPIIIMDSNEGIGGDGLVQVQLIDGDVEFIALELISLNDFRLCELNPKIRNPWSPVSCTGWNPTGRVLALAGDYRFRAELRDSRRVCGNLRVIDVKAVRSEPHKVPIHGGEPCPN